MSERLLTKALPSTEALRDAQRVLDLAARRILASRIAASGKEPFPTTIRRRGDDSTHE